MTTAMIFSGDGLFFGICIHLSSEFDIIGQRIQNLISQEVVQSTSDRHFSPETNTMIYEKLREIVIDHEKLIKLCKKMSRSFSTNVLLHYISAALITGICCLMVMLAEGADKTVFITYIGASTTQVFVYSYGGQMLAASSSKMQEHAYNFEWYKCDKKVRKLIQMIMIRTQKRTAVEVPFFQVSLETFISVSKISFV